ncbi:Pentatricopeptide repeat [Dillenia turbinata]|uniref:Pentatricopeptide repeat n=1 Tax=Dillenia turbinata TaxID=194707 RepID=A0AAN8WCN8_9MAGN
MAPSLVSFRRMSTTTPLSLLFKVRYSHSRSHSFSPNFLFFNNNKPNPTLILTLTKRTASSFSIKTLTTSSTSALPDDYQQPQQPPFSSNQPRVYQDQRNNRNPIHWQNPNDNHFNSANQNYPPPVNPNYQVQNYPQRRNFPNQQSPNHNYPPSGNPNPFQNYQNQNQNFYQPGNPDQYQGQNYNQPAGSHNHWNRQVQNYPPRVNPNPNPNQNQGYSQPGNANRWDNQNQGYLQRGNPKQTAYQKQIPYPNQGQGQVVTNQSPSEPPANVDLMSLCQGGKIKEVIEALNQGAPADANCFYALFSSIGNPKSLEDAKKVHDFFLRSSFRSDLNLNNKVIEMYSNCGSMTDARRVFDHMLDRNIDSCHVMINGYAANGLGDDGLQLFDKMRETGLRPTGETFLAVLASCATAEAIEEGFIHFESMKTEYGIDPGMEHYLGLIGVLGSSGHLAEAKEYIERMPVEPTAEVWETLRHFARVHGDIDLEDHTEELMVSLDLSKAVVKKIPTPPPKRSITLWGLTLLTHWWPSWDLIKLKRNSVIDDD